MTHPFISSGKLISYLMLAGLVAYGLNYQITKTLLHIAAFIALITWFRIAVSSVRKEAHSIIINFQDPRIILSVLLFTSALIVQIETSLSETVMSARFRNDFVLPAICFALVLPVATTDSRMFKLLLWAIPLSIITMAVPGIIDQFDHEATNYRTSGNISLQIIYGTNLSLIVVATLALMEKIPPMTRPILIVVCFIAMGLGMWAIVFSGSRGPLLSVFIVSILATTAICRKHFGTTKTAIIIFLLCSATSFAVVHSSMYTRIAKGITNISSGVTNSSMGLRFEMWRGAKDIITEHPLSGVGVGQHGAYFNTKILEDTTYMHHAVPGFIHLHNDVLNAMAWMGIPSGLLFMLFAVYPLIWAIKNRKTVTAPAIIAVVSVYLLNGLTNTPSIRATSLTLMLSVIFLLLQFSIYRPEKPDSSISPR